MNILIIGGAGFIGQHLARALVHKGIVIRVLDNFSPQVHQVDTLPDDLSENVELIRGDVRDRDVLKRALMGIDQVIHLAAETGTGQSMYEIERYFSVNVQGTATLIDLLQNDSCGRLVSSIIVASSRAVCGEGAYCCSDHGVVYPEARCRDRMSEGLFEPVCPACNGQLRLTATPETAPYKPMSVYGLTKQVQEQAILMFARARSIKGLGLRYQNVFGPGQALKNPYTGILAIFSNLARQGNAINVYEDGKETRDFVYIDDVVAATLRCVDLSDNFVGAINVGSGRATSVLTVAQEITAYFNSESSITVSGEFREGDIRHNIADLGMATRILGYSPQVNFKDGVRSFLQWAAEQPIEDTAAYRRSVRELETRGLMGISTNA